MEKASCGDEAWAGRNQACEQPDRDMESGMGRMASGEPKEWKIEARYLTRGNGLGGGIHQIRGQVGSLLVVIFLHYSNIEQGPFRVACWI